MSALRNMLQGGQAVTYYPQLARAVGGVAAALFLQQIAHWEGKSNGGWVFRTYEQLEEELAMSYKVQATCRKHLVNGGFMEEQHRAKNRLHYRIIWEKVEAALECCPPGKSSVAQPASLVLPDGEVSLKRVSNESKEDKPHPQACPAGGGGSAKKKIKALSPEEATAKWESLVDTSPHGQQLSALAQMLAEQNATKEVAITRVWRELGQRFVENQERYGYNKAEWDYGFEVAIAANAPNIGYVTKAAAGANIRLINGGVNGSGPAAPTSGPSPAPVVEAIKEREKYRQYAAVAEVWDFTKDETPEFRIMARLGGNDEERHRVFTALRSIANRTIKEREQA